MTVSSHSIQLLPEPKLEFGHRQSLEDPRNGLFLFGPIVDNRTPAQIRAGVVGTPRGVSMYKKWLRQPESSYLRHRRTYSINFRSRVLRRLFAHDGLSIQLRKSPFLQRRVLIPFACRTGIRRSFTLSLSMRGRSANACATMISRLMSGSWL